MSRILLNLANASVWREDKFVLSDINLSCGPGEIHCIIGRSGSGKSTLLLAVAGLLPLSAGSISILGTKPEHARANARMAILFQQPTLFPWLTVEENIRRALLFARIPKRDWNQRTNSSLRLAQIEQARNLYPNSLSGGMKTRAAIARAVALKPALMLLDEPFSGLDVVTREALHETLRQLACENEMTIVHVTHDLTEAVQLGHKLHVLGPRGDATASTLHTSFTTEDLAKADTSDSAADHAELLPKSWNKLRALL